ncbi:MAG: ABC transporter permease [Lentisphaeria bacterium]|nr:ABC transporter permease [Lentisphaeria bacterium]
MLRYIVRRIAYSLLIIAGIMILTFLLFRLSAGDPAATVLGKNPAPAELEAMREELGTDKPLFFGLWKPTEIYTSADFSSGHTVFPGVKIEGKFKSTPQGIELEGGSKVVFRRNFERAEPEKLQLIIHASGLYSINRSPCKSGWDEPLRHVISGQPAEIVLTMKDTGILHSVTFQRPTKGWYDSQLVSSLTEIVSFQKDFPYVSFFNFGKTLQTREPIRAKLWKGMFPSLMLMIPVFFGELILGILLAMLACVYRGQWQDQLILCLSVAGMSISYLALIIFGQWFLAYYLNWFPVWGWGDIRYLLLPVAIGILSGTGGGVRFYRTVFLDEMNREYLRTATAKGLPPVKVYFKHLFKNALIPVITRASTVLPFLFTGSLLLETFFGIPGLGYEGVNALNDADLQMLKALVILSAFLFVGINLLTDLAYAWADPRVRPGR